MASIFASSYKYGARAHAYFRCYLITHMAAARIPSQAVTIPLEKTTSAEDRDAYLHFIKYPTDTQLAAEGFLNNRTDAEQVLKLLLDPPLRDRDPQKFEEIWDDAKSFHPKLSPRHARLWCAELLTYGSVIVPEAVVALRDIQLVVDSSRGDMINAVEKAVRDENDLMRAAVGVSADAIDDATVSREPSMPTVRRESSIAVATEAN